MKTMARAVLLSILRFDKRFWKGFFGVETPLYRLWWERHSQCMQAALDNKHSKTIY